MRSAHLLPERSEVKTKATRQQYLPFTVLKRINEHLIFPASSIVATVLIVYDIETIHGCPFLGI